MIDKKEWQDICLGLLDHHNIFYKLGEIGKPILTDSIPTACVVFNNSGQFVNFLFNKDFWNESSFYEKLFVICHECLHVILNHGMRFRDSKNPVLSNIAMDIVVNHSLVNRFGFVRENIKGYQDYCWVDTIFKSKKIHNNPIPDDEIAEYYLNLLNKEKNKDNLQNFKMVDTHNFSEQASEMQEVFDYLNNNLSEEDKKGIQKFYEKHKDHKTAGDNSGGQIHIADKAKIHVKKKWESVIKNWTKKRLAYMDTNVEHWAKKHRRFSMIQDGLFLPSDTEIEDMDLSKKKIQVYFFLDTSGSCWNLKDRFFAAAESLPTKHFVVNLFCFDSTVYETDIKFRKMSGGGGTKFDILEKHIQNSIEKNNQTYPDAVFVITDLYGNKIVCEKPERWHWFVEGTPAIFNNLAKDYLQPQAKVFDLADFV
jgi:hypothetical protein